MEEPNTIESITLVFRSQELPQIDIQICQSNDRVLGYFKLLNNTSHTILIEKDIDDCYVSANNKDFAIENHFYIKIENIVADHRGHYKLVKKYDKFQLNVEMLLKGHKGSKKHMFDEEIAIDTAQLAHKTLMKIEDKIIREYELEKMQKEMAISKKTKKKSKLKGSVVGSRASNKKICGIKRQISMAYTHFQRNNSLSIKSIKNESKKHIPQKESPQKKLKTNKVLRFQLSENEKCYESHHQFDDEYTSLRVKKSTTFYQCHADHSQSLHKPTDVVMHQNDESSLDRQSEAQSYYASRLRKIEQVLAEKAVKMNQMTSTPSYKNKMAHLQKITAIQLDQQQKILSILNEGQHMKKNNGKGFNAKKQNGMRYNKNTTKNTTKNTSILNSQHTTILHQPSPYSLKLSTYFRSLF